MRVAIFAGSAAGPAEHREATVAFVRELAQAGVAVVYGGGRVGLMGLIADTALQADADVIGVIPQHLVDSELAHRGLTRLHIVAGMHERKARMAELADAFVTLPGGAGTLEELFEIWTWGQLGMHTKPAALLNIKSFYDQLLQQLNTMSTLGYLDRRHLAALGVVKDAVSFLNFITTYQHPLPKWSSFTNNTASNRGAAFSDG